MNLTKPNDPMSVSRYIIRPTNRDCVEQIAALFECVMTLRDYVSDTADGYDIRPHKTMVAEDLARVDAALASARNP